MHELVHIMQRTHEKVDEGNLIVPDEAEAFTSFSLNGLNTYKIVERRSWRPILKNLTILMTTKQDMKNSMKRNKTAQHSSSRSTC